MRVLVRSEVEVASPADVVWDYVTDWSRQGEWIPFSRVEPIGTANGVGGRVRARTGIGPVGFWDPMTITAWSVSGDGSARCEVLHTGGLVRGEAEFSVVARGFNACTFRWWEHLQIPGGLLGALVWRLAGRAMQKTVDLSLRRMAARVESPRAAG